MNSSHAELNQYLQSLEKKRQHYVTLSESDKQDYWNREICSWYFQGQRASIEMGGEGDFPINLTEYRTKNMDIEQNFDRFIPGIIKALYVDTLGAYTPEEFNQTTNDKFDELVNAIFILDELARRHLQIYTTSQDNSEKIAQILSLSDLPERIGDLFYDALAEVLIGIAEVIPPHISQIVLQASQHAQEAWKICKPYINNRTNPKHKDTIDGMNNKILGNILGKFDANTLKTFLKTLGDKIHEDGIADEKRGRKKLSAELFACSKKLADAVGII